MPWRQRRSKRECDGEAIAPDWSNQPIAIRCYAPKWSGLGLPAGGEPAQHRIMAYAFDENGRSARWIGFRIESAADAARLLGMALAEAADEQLYLVYLDSHGRLIAHAEQQGGPDSLLLSAGQIVRDLCINNACGLVIAHNHPSGDPAPSAADRETTRMLAQLLRTIDVVLIDHLIFARGGVTSFRGLGLL